jgi:hypothetical protein
MTEQKFELIQCDRISARHFAGYEWGSEGELPTFLIAELKARRGDVETFDTFDEAAPVGATAELAVSNDREPNFFLQLYNVADRCILGGGEAGIVDFAGMECAKRLAQRSRTQQAADVVGTNRRVDHKPIL